MISGSTVHGTSFVWVRALGIACLVAVLLSGRSVKADPLNPGSFTSLGTLDVTSGSITINTDTLGISGAAIFNGGTVSQGGGNPEIAVFTFGSLNIGAGVTVNVTGSRPLALLSQGSMNIASAISLTGGNGSGATAGAAGPGGYIGGTGGTTGGLGGGPGGGGHPTAADHDGSGGGYGGSGGLASGFSPGGPAYGNLLSVLQGGSGGGGARQSSGNAGGGGGGGGAIELGAVGNLTLSSTLTSNGGDGGDSSFDGGGGAGGGILIHAGTIAFNSLSAAGGTGIVFGGGGGGGRLALAGESLTAATINARISSLSSSVNGGNSVFATYGIAGVLSFRPDLATVQTTQSLNVGITPNQTGQTDPRIEVLPSALTVQSGGTATLISPLTWGSGSLVTMSGGTLNVNDDTTFAANSTLNWSSGNVVIASGKTLTFDGGVGTQSSGGSLSAGATLRVLNGGAFTAASNFHVANNLSSGTVLVDGSGSKFVVSSNGTEWGRNSGEIATVTFSNGGAGTFGGVRMSASGGSSTLTLFSGGQFRTTSMLITGNVTPGANALITINGGTLTSGGTATFRNGTVVDLFSGGLAFSNAATFSGSSTLNWYSAGALTVASGATLNIDGGFVNIPDNSIKVLSDNATLRITNAGKVDAPFSLRVGDTAPGTLLVDGVNSAIYSGSSATQWGRTTGGVATVTFSNFAAGTFGNILTIAGNGGTAVVTVSSGSTLSTSGLSTGSASLGSTATINIGGGNLESTGSAVFRNGTVVNFIAGTLRSNGTTNLIGNAQILLSTGGDKVVRTGRLSVSGTSKIDLSDNDMIIEGSTSPTTVRGYLQTGRNGGDWLGNGITSSSAAADPVHAALGYALASDIFNGGGGTFDGISVSNSAVLVKFTYPGDTNLDGSVNVHDLLALAINWKTSGVWTEGDFNYDGFIDKADLGLMALNWHAGYITPLGPALEELGLPALVPEPLGLAAIGLLACSLGRVRRRR